MSKYIRTENGIFDTSKGIYTPSIKMWAISTVTIYDEDIIEESDNLEDLIDGYVIAYENNRYSYCDIESDARQVFDWEKRNYALFLRGVIGTDDGLKYIAKYNEDKKEWELM